MNQNMANLNVNMFNNLINNNINNMNNNYNKALVNFIYNGKNRTFEVNPTSKMKEIFKKFSTEIKVNIESIIFLYNGMLINEDSELKDLLSNINQNEIKILVNDEVNYEQKEIKEKDDKSGDINSDIILSKYPICPKCGGIIRIDIKDYKINLFECDKGHEIKGLTFKKYAEIQKLDETKIICDDCKHTNKANTFENKFFNCLSCKMNLCPICKSHHDKSHGIISYDEKEFNCQIHNDYYNSYCNKCKKNICIECEGEHDDHDMISLGKFFPNKNKLRNYYNELKDKIDKLKEIINGIMNKMKEVVKVMNIYYKIISNHIDNYQTKMRNYQILRNINDFQKNKVILDDIGEIINESNIKVKIDYIFRIYNKIKDKKETDEKTINTINNKDNERQEGQKKYKQLNENNEQKNLEEKCKYNELNKKYEQLFNEYKKNIEEKNKLNQKILELEEVKAHYQILKNDFDKLNIGNSKYMGEKNKFEQLYNEFLNKYQDEKNQHDNLKKTYENQKKLIEDLNKKNKDLEKKLNNNNTELIEEKNKNKILEDKIKKNEKQFNEYIVNKVNELKIKEDNIKYVHIGINCKKCFEEPIIGYRYKCSICKNYNLCEKCKEKNEISKAHPHNFMKIGNECKEGQELPNFAFINNNNSNNNKDKLIKKVYSYDCLNKNKLSNYIYEGTDEAKIEIVLKNKGEEDWPINCTKLIFDKASKITGDEIVLKPQKSDEQNKYNVIFKKVSKYRVGEYKSYLLFCVNDEAFGEKLELTVGIKENKKNSDIDENIDKINEFRLNYDLDKDDYSNAKILEALKKNNFEYDAAFSSFFTDNYL